MKVYRRLKYYSMAMLTVLTVLVSCEDDYQSNSGNEAILLTSGETDLKAPGNGQYRLEVETGNEVSITANVASSVRSFTITKTMNLEIDADYGTNGVLTVDPSSFDSEYLFTYMPDADDVDQLVGFTFRAEKTDGSIVISDLTLAVTLSPRDNLPRRKWLFTSKIWVDKDNKQDIKECEKDNYLFFNEDHTMAQDFGTQTGTGDCAFDGFNVYDTWELSEDGQTFTMTYHSIFAPDNIQSEVYHVKTLTTSKIQLEIDIDLTWAGEGPDETFIYEYTAQPK